MGDGDGEKYSQARERGEVLRAQLLVLLELGPQTAVDLLAEIKRPDVSLSEVAFQLERLGEEGRVSGSPDGPYARTG